MGVTQYILVNISFKLFPIERSHLIIKAIELAYNLGADYGRNKLEREIDNAIRLSK